ncbi:protein dpy-30-like protein [Dinothrombium tinctorium]|uniref:Protein dpy-30-like protein n=1 Tax=Dinothrombium tinctorium TaxID=1965070 RepID=A0A3S3P3H0_9ACAR|nr:protein dpy-30-like protein [Dinothrombium tinctorium]
MEEAAVVPSTNETREDAKEETPQTVESVNEATKENADCDQSSTKEATNASEEPMEHEPIAVKETAATVDEIVPNAATDTPAMDEKQKTSETADHVVKANSNADELQAMEAEEAKDVSDLNKGDEVVSSETASAEAKTEEVTPPVTSTAAASTSKTNSTIQAPQSSTPQTQSKKPKVDLAGLATRQYLDQTVVPILLQALSSLAKTRPEDPIQFLANFLIEHKSDYEPGQENTAPINGAP